MHIATSKKRKETQKKTSERKRDRKTWSVFQLWRRKYQIFLHRIHCLASTRSLDSFTFKETILAKCIRWSLLEETARKKTFLKELSAKCKTFQNKLRRKRLFCYYLTHCYLAEKDVHLDKLYQPLRTFLASLSRFYVLMWVWVWFVQEAYMLLLRTFLGCLKRRLSWTLSTRLWGLALLSNFIKT